MHERRGAHLSVQRSGRPACLGLFGGSFDPVHNGHLRLAQAALDALALAALRWIPSGAPGHRDAPHASPAHRLAMLNLAIAADARHTVDAAELEPGKRTYTVDTLERIRGETGDRACLVFLIGGDQLMALDTWREWRRLFELAHFGVAARPGHPVRPAGMSGELMKEYRARLTPAEELARRPAGLICEFPMAPADISSTQVREAIASGRPPRDAVPAAVLDYIASHRLYRPGSTPS